MRYADRVNRPREGLKMGFDFGHADGVVSLKGTYIIHLTDIATGEVLDHREQSNIVTLDGGVLVAILLASGPTPVPPSQRGLTMLAVGTGATGPLLNPDAPDPRPLHAAPRFGPLVASGWAKGNALCTARQYQRISVVAST